MTPKQVQLLLMIARYIGYPDVSQLADEVALDIQTDAAHFPHIPGADGKARVVMMACEAERNEERARCHDLAIGLFLENQEDDVRKSGWNDACEHIARAIRNGDKP